MKWFLFLLWFPFVLATEPPLRFPAAERVIAIGDVHGDLSATRSALRLARLIDAEDNWRGGKTVLVQTGDQLDRGDEEEAILLLFAKLIDQAQAAGGAVHVLNGNHELMNAALDFRYVTEGGYLDFADTPIAEDLPADLPEKARPRASAFKPGAPYAMMFAQRNTVVIIGDSVFVHGGVLPEAVRHGLDRFNREVRAWLRGERERPEMVRGKNSPVWSRHFSLDTDEDDCTLLQETLALLGCKRMVVGHTVQEEGITSACDGRVWRVDVGMAAHYGGSPAVLEITAEGVNILR